ncbi:MAG TPA: hypothetical protein PKD24_05545 [Pyrinomonadaceae bacterium]|mgnify:CR=1 FL=1|nr:hypothetical protein [Pyrinomonadaceae bacterium]HMP65015.1 hypothetical protein [Pyrinomonadaceae bacterium]
MTCLSGLDPRFGRSLVTAAFLLAVVPLAAFSQKGVDPQTQRVREDASKTTSRGSDATRSFDWGKGKTRTRERLPNPYILNGRRDTLVEIVQEVLREKRLVLDEASSRLSDGLIVTQPFQVGRGPVIATAELRRYGVLEFADTAWSRGQYSLIIEIQPIDGIRSNVSVTAKVEGRSGQGLMTEWVTVPSSGLAEEEFLVKLVEMVTGISPDDALRDGQ